jgi:hypothetical protein
MARPKGSKNKETEEAIVKEVSEVVEEYPDTVLEDVPEVVEVVEEEKIEILSKEKEEIVALRKKVADLEETKRLLESRKSGKSLEEYLKDPNFGTTSYLTINTVVGTDPNGRQIRNAQGLSAFPDLVDPVTGLNAAPDVGFDGPSNEKPYPGRKAADIVRNSKTEVPFEGKLTPIKDVIYQLRVRYFEKRNLADEMFLKQQKIA